MVGPTVGRRTPDPRPADRPGLDAPCAGGESDSTRFHPMDAVPTSTSKSGEILRHAAAGPSERRPDHAPELPRRLPGLVARRWLGSPAQVHSDLDFRTAWPAERVSFGRLRTSVLSRNW